MDQVKLKWEWEFGAESEEPDQPLAIERTIRGILEEGKPQRAIRWLFFKPNLNRPEVFWLGALLLSQGLRVIFFPAVKISGFSLYHGSFEHPGHGFSVDHITLESTWDGWHLTGTNRRKRQAGFRAMPLESGGILWFGMKSAGPENTPQVRRRNVLFVNLPESDSKRRISLLGAARNEAIDQILALNELSYTMPPPWVVQFNFAVGKPGFVVGDDELSRFLVNPKNDPTGGRSLKYRTFARLHRIWLSDEIEVLIATFPVPGTIDDRWAIMSWG